MIRVLALITYRIYPMLMGGQKGVALFYKALAEFIDVRMALSKNNAPATVSYQRNLLFTNRLLPLNILRYGVLKKWIMQDGVSLIIAEHSYAGWIAYLLKKKTGIPFLIHSHNLEAQRFKFMKRRWWWLYEVYEKWIHQKADFNFFISDTDKAYAIKNFQLEPARCATITYGVDRFEQIPEAEINTFLKTAEVPPGYPVLFFNGTLDYEPNIAAVYNLADNVIPRLVARNQLFKILISGNRISDKLLQFIQSQPHLLYLDYVPDVRVVYQAAALFINPICNNTGVKTKVLEALGNHCSVVSTSTGASGIWRDVCGTKLCISQDGDWDAFADSITQQLQKPAAPTPASFFATYLWSNIAAKAAAEISKVAHKNA